MNYKKTFAWKRSIDLAICINQITRSFPSSEKTEKGISYQLLQSALRIPNRIAESHSPGLDMRSDMLMLARYHLSETEFLLEFSMHIGYISKLEHERLQSDVNHVRMLINKKMCRFDELEIA
jgi:four helix bundle protein